MKITFRTKEDSNKLQTEDFLKLSKSERIYAFINLLLKSKQLPKKTKAEKSDNFLIEIKTS